MANNNQLNIEIKVNRKELADAKADLKNFTNELKMYSKAEVEQIKANAKISTETVKQAGNVKVQELKNISAKEIQILKDTLKQQENLRKQANSNAGSGTFKGQSVTLGSEQAIKEQIKYWNQYKTTLAGADPQIQSTTKHINQLKTSLNQIKGGGASRSDWEHWENLTTVFAGIGTALYGAFLAGQQFISFITDAVKKAAELEVYSKAFIEIAGSTEKASQQLQQLYIAAAGNLNETELITYSNKMRLLGVDVERTTQLLDIIERQSDKVSVTFSEGESILQSYLNTGRDRTLTGLGLDIATVRNEVEKLTLEFTKNGKEAELEDLKLIRLNAIINLYGDSLTNINQKQKDSGDRIKSLSTLYDKFTTETGKTFLEMFNRSFDAVERLNTVMVKLGGTFGVTGGKSNIFIDSLKAVQSQLLKTIFPVMRLVDAINFLGSEYDYVMGKFKTAGFASETDGSSNIDRPLNPKYDGNFKKIAKKGIGEEQILDKVTGSKGSGTSKTIAEITNEIIRLNKSLADLTAEQLSLGESAKGTSIFAIYLLQIQEIQDKLKYLNSPFKDSTGLDFITNLPKYDNSQNIQGQELSFAEQVNLTGIDKEAMQKEAYDKIVNGSQQALSNVENIFQILDIGTETFVSKLVSGMQTTLSIIDAIAQAIQSFNTVKQGIGVLSSLLSFVPGGGFIGTATAGFGNLSGGGRNIGNLSTGGGQSPMVNKIYINSTLDTQKFFGDGVTTFYKNRNLNTVG